MVKHEQNPHARFRALARLLTESTLDVLWKQWSAVDAMAAGKGHAQAMVDPEALLLMSLTLWDEERRLADLVQSWAKLNSGILSVQRAKNLVPGYPDRTKQLFSWFAGVALTEGKDSRWRSALADSLAEPGIRMPKPRRNKERAIRVRLEVPAALLLRLRLGFGVGAKADLLGYLLGIFGDWATVREISEATTYTVAGIRRAADEMSVARLIQSSAAFPISYRADPDSWSRVLGLGRQMPPWRSWHQRFNFVAAFLTWEKSLDWENVTSYAAGAAGRELMEKHRSAFETGVIAVWSKHTPVTDWVGFVESGVTSLSRWMRANA
jgi:hypothetical protein